MRHSMRGGGKPFGDFRAPASGTFEAIARRAYELYLRSGSLPGRDEENWIAAETELKREIGATETATKRKPNGHSTVQPLVKVFCKAFHLTRDTFTRMTGYSSRAVAGWAAGKPVSTSSTQRLNEIARLCEALRGVVKEESIGRWLQTPNEAFDGSTPIQVIERGEVDRLWRMIYRLESGEPG